MGSDSLIIAESIEVIGRDGGEYNLTPYAAGARYIMELGFDFGAPQPVVDILAQGTQDGERPYGRRSGNRTFVLPITVMADNRDMMVAAREYLFRLTNQDTWDCKWQRDGGPVIVYHCYRGQPAKINYSLTDENSYVSSVTITFSAEPFGFADVPEVLSFDTNVRSSAITYFSQAAPPAPITLDDYSSLASGNAGWRTVAGEFPAEQGGNAISFEVDNDYVTQVHYTSASGDPVDLTYYPVLSVWAGFTVVARQIYTRRRFVHATFSVTLTDQYGHRLKIGETHRARVGEYRKPVWQRFSVRLPDVTPGFDRASIVSYVMHVHNKPDGTTGDIEPWLGKLMAFPPTSHAKAHSVRVPASSRGIIYDISGVKGTARAPLNLTLQQYSSTGSYAAEAEYQNDDQWIAPEGCTATGVVITYPAAEFASDDLEGTALGSLWGSDFGGGVTYLADGVHIEGPSSSTTFSGITSAAPYDVTGSWISARVDDAGDQSVASWQVFPVRLKLDASNELDFVIANGNVIARKIIATASTDLHSAAYSSGTHKLFRIREHGGTTYWETSADDVTWTLFHSVTSPLAVTSLTAVIQAGKTASSATDEVAIVTDFAYGTNGDTASGSGVVVTPLSVYPVAFDPASVSFTGDAATVTLPVPAGPDVNATLTLSFTSSVPRPFRTALIHRPAFDAGLLSPMFVPLFSSGAAGDGASLGSGVTLPSTGSHTLLSPNEQYVLDMQSDGNLVVYYQKLPEGWGAGPAVWSSRTNGHGGGHATMGSDGFLRVYDGVGAQIYIAPQSGGSVSGSHLELMNDGMLVIFSPSGSPVWSSRMAPGAIGGGATPGNPGPFIVPSVEPGFNARFAGTYSILLAGWHWDTPDDEREIQIRFILAEQQVKNPGTSQNWAFESVHESAQLITRKVVPSEDLDVNSILDMGTLTIPDRELPPENDTAYYQVHIMDSNVNDQFLDLLLLDTMGSTIFIKSRVPYAQFLIDEPTPERDIPWVSGSVRDRRRAVSVLADTKIGGGPPSLEPGDNRMLAWSRDGTPAVIASYVPRYFIDRRSDQ
jgi:hypothetical protein